MTTTLTEQLAIWQQDANRLYRPIPWLPFWRPIVIAKRGRFSPWFWPILWAARSGVFNLFFLLIVSEDLLNCPPHHRRAIIAHECGHLSGFHSLIWMLAGILVLKNDSIRTGFIWISHQIGPWISLGAFLTFLVLTVLAFRGLLHWFEYQADDYAVSRTGATELIEALSFISTQMFGPKGSPWVKTRIQRLQLLHGL